MPHSVPPPRSVCSRRGRRTMAGGSTHPRSYGGIRPSTFHVRPRTARPRKIPTALHSAAQAPRSRTFREWGGWGSNPRRPDYESSTPTFLFVPSELGDRSQLDHVSHI